MDGKMSKKYLVIADYVLSKNDGDRHFINCNKLMQLYAVHKEECICVESEVYGRYYPPLDVLHRQYGGLIELRPKYNGDYSIPIKNQSEGGGWKVWMNNQKK